MTENTNNEKTESVLPKFLDADKLGIDYNKALVSLEPEELKILQRYVKIASDLESESLFKNYIGFTGFSISIDYKNNISTEVQLTYPSEESLKSALTTMRLIYLQKEHTNFNKVIKLLKKKAHNSATDDGKKLVAALNQFKDKMKQAEIQPLGLNLSYQEKLTNGTIEKIHLTPKDNLDMWLNAVYFHWDHEKELKIQNSPIPEVLQKASFLEAVKSYAIVYIALKYVLNEILKELIELDK